ncbi:MAG: hypothetical protein NC313_02445 [Butyrivibrio sp.]|nr:hypothetical protein [Butyrivibrio sp.]
MRNPIKNRFQRVYDETHIKPFTFLNCFLCILLPIIGFIVGGMLSGANGGLGIAVMILGLLGGWVGNFLLLFRNFQKAAIGLFFLNILASIAFFGKLILVPFLKASVKFGMAAWQSNLGNVTASVNASSEGGAELASSRTSAFNWFEYDGYVWKDAKQTAQLYEHHELDAGSYTDEQNQQARNSGYANAKEAEMHGVKID